MRWGGINSLVASIVTLIFLSVQSNSCHTTLPMISSSTEQQDEGTWIWLD